MLNISSQEAATRTRMGVDAVSTVLGGSGMSAFGTAVARGAYKVPTAADAATAQGDQCAWSHPV